ncbi:DUF7507 domain-containing protein [Martelella mangrovi]|uniref:Repeat protein (TIGR01451 family) n=1 Tax=Martelella mangrovi TaxID=1397477 RepID=A0ABV2I757_9HYPH
MYLSQGNPNTTLYRVDTSTNPFTYPPIGVTNDTYNAMGFNPVDNYLYAIHYNISEQRFHLWRIGDDGQATNLGQVQGAGINTHGAGIASGEIGPDGSFYVKFNGVSTGAAGFLYKIDVTNPAATTSVQLSQTISTADLAWHEGLLYGHSMDDGHLYTLNPNSGQVTDVGDSGIINSFGAMIGASNGVFGALNTGGFYQFDLDTGEATLLSDSPASSNNDGAKCATTPLQFGADLAVTKTDDNEFYKAGKDVTYTIVVTNNGPFGTQNAGVLDELPDGITEASWTCGNATGGAVCGASSGTGSLDDPGDFPAGASLTYTLTLSVPEDFSGNLENVATVTVPETNTETDISNNSATDVDQQALPEIALDKTGALDDANGNGFADAGETIAYSFLVENTGNVTLTDVTVDDPRLADAGVSLDQVPQTLAPGDSFTFTATYTVTQADVDAGVVDNTATSVGTDPFDDLIESDPDTVTFPTDTASSVTLDKDAALDDANGNGFADAGETIAYSFVVENTGALTLTDVTVDDAMLAAAGVALDQGPQTLAPGDSFTFTASYTVTQADVDAGSVDNSATATGVDPDDTAVESDPDTATVPADTTAAMTVDKTGALDDANGNGFADAGETIVYSFLVENTGSVTLTDVTVDDPKLAAAGVAIDQPPQTLAPGDSFTFTATYTVTQADVDAGSVENSATTTATTPDDDPIESDPDTEVTDLPASGKLEIAKSGLFNDDNGNGYSNVGETITYTVTVENTGNVTLTDVVPQDGGPTFDSQPGEGTFSAFDPASARLAPGESQSFIATYTLAEVDIERAGGISDAVSNVARATGVMPDGSLTPEQEATSIVALPAATPQKVVVTKQALVKEVRRGGKAPYFITVTNTQERAVTGITVTDRIPSGFRYVEGSASVDDEAVTPDISGRDIRFRDISVDPDQKVVIRVSLEVLSSTAPGKYKNAAFATDLVGRKISDTVYAEVEIPVEPVFDCGDIIGKVFDDLNRDGYQDEGEPGLPGVRVATVNGVLVTTDPFGRFHVACAALPDNRIGSNFIMKLDERTLPSGYSLTTENPRVVRLTAGKMTKLNFGASIGRVVSLDLTDASFVENEITLKPDWLEGLDQLTAILATEPSILDLNYYGDRLETLARERLKEVSRQVRLRWKAEKEPYSLEITTHMEASK